MKEKILVIGSSRWVKEFGDNTPENVENYIQNFLDQGWIVKHICPQTVSKGEGSDSVIGRIIIILSKP